MAVAISTLTTGSSGVGATSYASASITPTANQLVIAVLATRTGITTAPTQPTATGCGLTWVVVASTVYDNSGSSQRRLTVFRAMGASPSTGAVTFDEAGQSQTDAQWAIDTFTGMDTTGTNGSGAVVQGVANQDTTATVAAITATLAAFGSANNATYGAGAAANGLLTRSVGAGFTVQDTFADTANNNLGMLTEFNAGNDTTVDWSLSGNSEIGIIGIEIKAAVAAFTFQQLTDIERPFPDKIGIIGY